jgi:hypothetical protein
MLVLCCVVFSLLPPRAVAAACPHKRPAAPSSVGPVVEQVLLQQRQLAHAVLCAGAQQLQPHDAEQGQVLGAAAGVPVGEWVRVGWGWGGQLWAVMNSCVLEGVHRLHSAAMRRDRFWGLLHAVPVGELRVGAAVCLC